MLCFREAQERFWGSNIGYLVRVGYYRYQIGGHEDAFTFSQRGIKTAEAEFAFELHRRRCAALTLEDMFSENEEGERYKQNTLNARASRFFRNAFSLIPEKERPYEVMQVPCSGHRTGAGYLLRAGITWCMIVDQVWTGKIRPLFDWSLFLDPPDDGELRPSA